MSLAENIYRYRTEQNMSQLDLADALEVSRQSVSKWETGTAVPELEKLIKMSDLFGVSLDELVGRKVEPPNLPVPEITESHSQEAPRSITTEDMVSILILLFAILIPVVILATSESHNSTLLMILGLMVVPPLATIFAAFLSPKNALLFWIYVIYDIIFGILAVIAGSVLAPFIAIIYLFAIGLWNDARA